jgi:uncharacterized membrane protein
MEQRIRPLISAGLMLGVGVGGFIDGVFLHQIFQVHAMLSARLPLNSMANMQENMTADGLFHAAMLLAVVIGIAMLFAAGKRDDVLWSGRMLSGAMVMGWGLFNIVEGVIDHHVLQLHHVVERYGLSGWDWAFLAASAGLVVTGWLIARTARVRR